MEGSSKMYKMPVSCEPICVAKRMRCDSPPERLFAGRFMLR